MGAKVNDERERETSGLQVRKGLLPVNGGNLSNGFKFQDYSFIDHKIKNMGATLLALKMHRRGFLSFHLMLLSKQGS